jgi:hypothetical protein
VGAARCLGLGVFRLATDGF